jgi:hypothetical protein
VLGADTAAVLGELLGRHGRHGEQACGGRPKPMSLPNSRVRACCALASGS